MNKIQNYIYIQEGSWLPKIQPFLDGKVLKIGNGLGYMSSFIKNINPNLTVIDICVNKHAANKNEIVMYDGIRFPFDDKSFDCVIAIFVLHHTPNPLQILAEMKRVAKRVVILDETYINFLSKLDLVWRDIYVNIAAGQTSEIHWKSYFKDKTLEKTLKNLGMSIVHHQKEKKRSYFKELYILE